MACNRVQFQPGMSLSEFLQCCGTEAHCAAVLQAASWPGDFRCPHCQCDAHHSVGHGAWCLFQCNACRHQTSLTTGSMMEHTKWPLTTSFLAVYLISQAKSGLSALALKRQLGVSYSTGWLLHEKTNSAMTARESCHRLQGDVQVDDVYLDSVRAVGKPGPGSENNVPFAADVSLDHKNRPRFLKVSMGGGFFSDAIRWPKASLAPGSAVISRVLACFTALATAGCTHLPIVAFERKLRDLPQFVWANTVLGNPGTILAGACHSLKYRKYGALYLAASLPRRVHLPIQAALRLSWLGVAIDCRRRSMRAGYGNFDSTAC